MFSKRLFFFCEQDWTHIICVCTPGTHSFSFLLEWQNKKKCPHLQALCGHWHMLPCCSERSQWGGCRHGFQSGSWWSGAARRWQRTLGPEPWQLSLCFQTSPHPRHQGGLCHEVGLVQWWGRGVFGWLCPSPSGAVLSAYPTREEASVVSLTWCIIYIEFKQLQTFRGNKQNYENQ